MAIVKKKKTAGRVRHFDSLEGMFNHYVPRYESRSMRPFLVTITWNAPLAKRYTREIREISSKRADDRWNAYVDVDEMVRVQHKLESKGAASVRFGVSKTGHGYHGERGDFCLVAGYIKGRHLTLFYRSLELIGGLAYDITLIEGLADFFHPEHGWKTVTLMAVTANVFALKRNSNEKLYPKLRKIFGFD